MPEVTGRFLWCSLTLRRFPVGIVGDLLDSSQDLFRVKTSTLIIFNHLQATGDS